MRSLEPVQGPRDLFTRDPERYKKLVSKVVNYVRDLVSTLTAETRATTDFPFAVLIEPSPTDRAFSQAEIITLQTKLSRRDRAQ